MPKRSEDLPEEYAAYVRVLGSAIGARIQARRHALGLSQERLRTQMELENVAISRSQFSRIETGQALPDAAHIVVLTRILQVSSDWLLFGNDDSAPGQTSA